MISDEKKLPVANGRIQQRVPKSKRHKSLNVVLAVVQPPNMNIELLLQHAL